MTVHDRPIGYALALICATGVAGATRDTTATRARVAFAHALPRLDGSHLEVKIVEVVYQPGEASPPHSHPCPVIGYGIHQVSANASRERPAKLVAYFVCDRSTPRSVPVPDSTTSAAR